VPRTTNRSFLAQLRSVGVDDTARGPSVSDNIQLVYVVDDLSRLIAPRSPVEGFVTIGVPAAAAAVSGILFTPPTDSAAIVTWMRNDSAIDSLFEVGTGARFALPTNLTAGTIDFFTGPGPPRASFVHGAKALQTQGLLIPAGENIPDRFPDLVIEPGELLLWIGDTVNTATELSWSWREVPV